MADNISEAKARNRRQSPGPPQRRPSLGARARWLRLWGAVARSPEAGATQSKCSRLAAGARAPLLGHPPVREPVPRQHGAPDRRQEARGTPASRVCVEPLRRHAQAFASLQEAGELRGRHAARQNHVHRVEDDVAKLDEAFRVRREERRACQPAEPHGLLQPLQRHLGALRGRSHTDQALSPRRLRPQAQLGPRGAWPDLKTNPPQPWGPSRPRRSPREPTHAAAKRPPAPRREAPRVAGAEASGLPAPRRLSQRRATRCCPPPLPPAQRRFGTSGTFSCRCGPSARRPQLRPRGRPTRRGARCGMPWQPQRGSGLGCQPPRGRTAPAVPRQARARQGPLGEGAASAPDEKLRLLGNCEI
jgi:hypothetical protein